MASLNLDRQDAKTTAWHPGLCARCGQPAEFTRRRRLSWTPGWVYIILLAGFLPFVIVYLVLTQKATVVLPFCNRHRNHWRVGNYVMYGGLAFGALLLALFVAVAVTASKKGKDAHDLVMGFGLIGCGFSFVLWVTITAVVQYFLIRAGRITETTVTVVSLCDAFCTAVAVADQYAGPEELRYAELDTPSPRVPPPPAKAGALTKLCPYCSEEIKAAAIKCRFCGESLE